MERKIYTLEVKTVTIERTKIKKRLYILIGLDGEPVKILEATPHEMPLSTVKSIMDWCEKYIRNLNEKLRAQSRNL